MSVYTHDISFLLLEDSGSIWVLPGDEILATSILHFLEVAAILRVSTNSMITMSSSLCKLDFSDDLSLSRTV